MPAADFGVKDFSFLLKGYGDECFSEEFECCFYVGVCYFSGRQVLVNQVSGSGVLFWAEGVSEVYYAVFCYAVFYGS